MLSIVIPTHHRLDLLASCLATVTRHAPRGTEILVVDDGSPRAQAGLVARRFDGVRVVRRERRGGFAAAANAGIRASRGDIIALLNDDTEVLAGWAEPALDCFADPAVAAVAPLVFVWPAGTIIDSAGDRYYVGGVAGKRGHGQPVGPDFMHPRRVFGASASSAFYRRAALDRVGLFAEEFGSYFEDIDLSFRLQRAGYEIQYEPKSRVLHHVGASHQSANPRLLAQQARNEELVFWRNMPAEVLAWALPKHLAVLAAKAWRRWLEGTLGPFLGGRWSALRMTTAIVRHREQMARASVKNDLNAMEVDTSW